jgi:hypothetical protein
MAAPVLDNRACAGSRRHMSDGRILYGLPWLAPPRRGSNCRVGGAARASRRCFSGTQATSLNFGVLLLQNVSQSFRAAFRFSFEPMPSLASGC